MKNALRTEITVLSYAKKRYIFTVYNVNPNDPSVIRGVVTKKTKEIFLQQVKDMWGADLASKFDISHYFSVDASSLAEQIPGIHQKVKHPVKKEMQDLMHVVMNLNDEHQWTREQIADWLDTLDNQPKFGGADGIQSTPALDEK